MKFSKKNLENLKRHRYNVTRLNIRNEQLAKETEEKEFKKYISFYWIKRSQEKAKLRRKREKNNRLKEKEEILITALQNKEKNKMREKEKAIANMIERENQAKKNVEQYLEEQEKNRLEFQKVIQERSK